MNSLKPPRLKKGDVIGLVSPASRPVPRAKIEGAVCYLESLGYGVKLGDHADSEFGYLAGTDEQRAADFNTFLRDDSVNAIFALRGGYGCGRILSFIDYRAVRRNPKIISGFSDITALQLALYRRCRLVTFSGPMPAVEFWKDLDPYTEANFWRLLTSPRKPAPLVNPPDDPIRQGRPGKATGVLLGGNLALVTSLLGTPYMPSFKKSILLLEEVDEYPYRADRMFTQLRNAGILDSISGLALGKFTRCDMPDPKQPHRKIDDLLQECCDWSPAPSIRNLCYGHVPSKLTAPFGVDARLDTKSARIDLLEAAVV